MSTPPSLYGVIPECLAAHGLNTEENGWKRIIVEKPFGYDEKQHKNSTSKFIVSLKNIKSIVSTIILVKKPYKTYFVLRFSNGLFEPLWNRNYIDYVEITGAEAIGVEERGGYYDGSGAMRDMFQNHFITSFSHRLPWNHLQSSMQTQCVMKWQSHALFTSINAR